MAPDDVPTTQSGFTAMFVQGLVHSGLIAPESVAPAKHQCERRFGTGLLPFAFCLISVG